MIEFGHGTHVGLRREHNEDTYCAEPELGLWLVADGMGGHQHGEVASALARDTIIDYVREGKSLTDAISLSNERIIEHSRLRGESLPMGTTVVGISLDKDSCEYELAWVGDSRIYRFDGRKIEQLSSDHSYVQELVTQGAISAAQAKTHPHRNVVTQALGVTDPDDLKVECHKNALNAGEYILLCSDGLTEEVSDEQIEAILKRELSAQEAVDHLILAALDNGGSDNITVLLIGRSK